MYPWRRRNRFFDDFFSDFEEDFKKMQEHMAGLFNEAMSRGEGGRSYVYGVTIHLGPGGRPQISEFGDTPKTPWRDEGRQPLVEVIDTKEGETKIITELPGVEKEDINVSVEEEKVVIDTSDEKRKFHKEIPLMDEVVPDAAKATYKNGILEITLKNVMEKQEQKKKIKVE